jgi:hypothetical protein
MDVVPLAIRQRIKTITDDERTRPTSRPRA